MNQIEVLVKDKSTDDQRTMTYKSYLDLTDRFELIGQVDQSGNLIPGDPNLNPRHRKVAVEDVAVHAAEPGSKPSMEELQRKKEELIQRFTPKTEEVPTEVEESKQRKKPGPKPKVAA